MRGRWSIAGWTRRVHGEQAPPFRRVVSAAPSLSEPSQMPFLAASAVQQLMTDARVPGLSMAVIDDRQATALTVVGVRNSLDSVAVDQQTIFAAASLSKPLFAYAVLQMVDAGKLAFDTPLSLHVPDYVADDPPGGCRHRTARSEPHIGPAQLALCRSSTQDVLPIG